jgi:Pvc16 N-terminal domain
VDEVARSAALTMALLDLSLVTSALVGLLEANIGNSSVWPPSSGIPLVTAQPPDELATGTLGVYLYHVSEDPLQTNQPPSPHGNGPVAPNTAMRLQLHYQICAVGSGALGAANLQEQLLIGLAMKAFPDFPVLDDNVRVPRRAPLPPLDVLRSVGLDGAGNRLRIALQPVAYDAAHSFWNASAPRLAVYYGVSVVLLDEPSTTAAPVTDGSG